MQTPRSRSPSVSSPDAMAGPFAALVATAAGTVAAVFGEEFRLIARTSGDPNARSGADASRPPVIVRGVFNEPSLDTRPQGRGIAASNMHAMVRQRPSVTLQGALAWRPAKHDRVERIATGRVYEVAEAHSQSHDLTRLELVT